MNKTNKRILYEKLKLYSAENEKRIKWVLENPQWFRTTKVKTHNIKRYNKLQKAIALILEDINYQPTEKQPGKPKQTELFTKS